ncbi:hypothetical protein Syun_024291 [Stephania yunnanensis]|uniref:Cytochrome P450 n=1 Tax=Stephania yunnanensis TaxID=152371 RepID=A0AAP0NIY7_9MAGN
MPFGVNSPCELKVVKLRTISILMRSTNPRMKVRESDRLRQVIEKEMLKVETLMVECRDRHYKFDVFGIISSVDVDGTNSTQSISLNCKNEMLRLIRSRLKQSNLPPSPPTLPLIGNIHQLGGLLHRSFRDLSQKYGPIILVHFGPVPIVVVSSPAIAEQIMKTHDLVFANRPMMTSSKIILYECVDVGLAPYGEKWKQLRKICINELLSVKKVKTLKRVREEEVACMVESIHVSSSLGI